ncbi:MAG TPA: hypothetical protein VHR66_24820 [Gemmataceae bacterium]|nr:hypothetical protein [Gemmataceae bacterium]
MRLRLDYRRRLSFLPRDVLLQMGAHFGKGGNQVLLVGVGPGCGIALRQATP